jgi:hypothetical protein
MALENTWANKELERNAVAKQAHNSDLHKTGQLLQGKDMGDLLVLVSFPNYNRQPSCRGAGFQESRVILTLDQVLKTNSDRLMARLNSEPHQRRARKASGTLPHGVSHVLDLSPPGESWDEDDYTLALQNLSLTPGIKLWYRASAFGASTEAVAGHDDVCHCKEAYNDLYPIPTPPPSIQGDRSLEEFNFSAFILDTENWAVDNYHDIDDYCPVRHGANVLRLFRSLDENDLLIDSAARSKSANYCGPIFFL